MSSRKNFRRRTDAGTTFEDENPSPVPKSSTKAKPKPPPPNPNRLSFVDDEDDDDVSPAIPRRVSSTPSSSSSRHVSSIHKISSSKSRAPPPPPPSSARQPPSGEYTKERLLELQKNTRTLASSSKSKPSEPVIVLRGLIKPDNPVTNPDPKEAEELTPDLGIPDQEMIAAARAKRERLRQSWGPLPEYISLDGGSALSAGRKGADSSGDEDEERDFRGRISLFPGKETVPPATSVFEPDMGGEKAADEEEDVDEEDRRWEEEQLSKALGRGKRIDSVEDVSRVSKVRAVPQPQAQVPAVFSTMSLETKSIAEKAVDATRALNDSIEKLKKSHGKTMSDLLHTDENLTESLEHITALENSLESADEKYVYMQKLRDYISVLCDFLKDKALLIEELEEEMQKLHEQRAVAVEERRAADNVDESNEVESAVSAAMSVLSKGSGAAYVSAAANAAQAALAAAREGSNLPVQVDEFGRDVNLQKRMDFTRRADARKRRRTKAESKLISSIQIEGELTSDESDSESTAYKSTHDELLQTADQIFSDAEDKYSKLSIVKEEFENWKKKYVSAYRDAYMSMSAPAIFTPYVRLELLKWDPLYNMSDFYDMEWHKLLFDYGLPGEDGFDPEDADANLIPVIVEKVALPILHHEVAHCWDIFSTRRTENAVYATNLIISYIPASSKALQELLGAVCDRLTKAVADISVPMWRPEVIRVVPGAAQFAAYRFGTSVRLLRNICLWKDVVSLPVLEKLALEDLLIRKLLPHVRSIMSDIHDAITRTERIVASLSGVWYGPKVTMDHSQKLIPLVDCVSELGRKLERRLASGLSQEETAGLARRLKTMLVQLNEYDKARAMLRTFHLKEAL